MLALRLPADRPLQILCLGAHCDDIEIGCGGTLSRLLADRPGTHVTWVVMTGSGEREAETRHAADLLLGDAASASVAVHGFRDGFLPSVRSEVKEVFEALKDAVAPDLILTHHATDAHQDHRLVSELTWNTFRGHLVLEYEIPKYDGDLGRPNVYVPLDAASSARKIDALLTAFPSQHARQWFDEETFRAMLRLRGLECNAPERYAEAFHARKVVLR